MSKKPDLPDVGGYLSKSSNTKMTRSITGIITSSSNLKTPTSGAPRKKPNKSLPPDDLLPGLRLLSFNFATSEQDNTLRSKRMNRLTKSHLPTTIKLIQPLLSANIQVLNFQLSVNKKTASKDWIVEYYNGKFKQVAADAKMLGVQEPAWYVMREREFARRFGHKMRGMSSQQISKVFNGYCLPNQQSVLFPIAILQPLNFDNLNEVGYVIGEGIVDRKDILEFVDREREEDFTEVVMRSQEEQEGILGQEGSNMQESMGGQESMGVQSSVQQNVMMEVEPEQDPEPSHNQFEVGPKTVLIWFIGTNVYSFVEIDNRRLVHFNSIPEQKAQSILSKTPLKQTKQQLLSILKSCNRSLKLYNSQIRPEQKRLFMYRLARSKTLPIELFLILRFKQVKQQRHILLRSLQTCQLQWHPLDQFQVCYTLPQFSKHQLQYLYILDQLPEPSRQSTIQQLLLSDFYHQQLNMRQLLQHHYPNKPWSSKNRCLQCHYILHTLPCIQCLFCHQNIHTKCLTVFTQKQTLQLDNSTFEWVCTSCQPCKVCFSRVQSPLICHECGSRFHRECGKTKTKLLELTQYECEDCLKCDVCGKRLRNCKEGGYVLVEENIQCEECNSIQGDYCCVCKRASNNEQKAEWIQCSRCESWVHKSCDAAVARTHNKHFLQPTSEYHCPKCRNLTKRHYLKLILEIMKKFDQPVYFAEPDYNNLPDYLDIIRQPMCFRVMLDKCSQGHYDTDSYNKISSDFNLIVSNALTYNMPKDDAHRSARIMKLMGDLVLEGMAEFMGMEGLELITRKEVEAGILAKEREVFRYIYGHYLEILLNYGQRNSRVVVRMKQPVELPELLYFKSKDILQRFKTSQLQLIYSKQQPKIQHLFSLQKTLQAGTLPATRPLCYYHHTPQTTSTCNICCESFCCVKKCFLHLTCTYCNKKGCRCSNWGCGCRAGVNLRELENPIWRNYRIEDITEMYAYCLRCSAGNWASRLCKVCGELCAYGFVRCEGCRKRVHRRCSRKTFIPGYCYECERSPSMQPKLKQQLKQQTRRQLFRMIRTQRYVPLILRLFLQQGIRLSVHHVRQLIFSNYDKVEQHLQQVEFYESNIFQIEKTKIKEQRMRLMQETINGHLLEFRSRLQEGDVVEGLNGVQFTLVDQNGRNFVKEGQYKGLFDKFYERRGVLGRVERVEEIVREEQRVRVEQVVFDDDGDMEIEYPKPTINSNSNPQQQPTQPLLTLCPFSSKLLTRCLYTTSSCLRPKPMTVSDARSQAHDYKNSQLTLRKFQQVSLTCRNLFISFYNELKTYMRHGSTSVLQFVPGKMLKVYKKWDGGRPGMLITLRKEEREEGEEGDKGWVLTVDNETKVVNSYKDLAAAFGRFREFATIEDLGAFLGCTFYVREERKSTYTKFLQTNPLDNDSFLERKQKVMAVYPQIVNNPVQQKQLFFLNKKTSPLNKQPQSKRNFDSFYILFDEIKKDLQDTIKQQKTSHKFTQPTKQIFIAPSTIHKLGLFSRKHHQKNTVLIEYMGEILGQPVADIREAQYRFGCYMFGVPIKKQQPLNKYQQQTVDQSTPHIQSKKDVIDATFRGNQARYLNHSCDPNCASTVEYENKHPRILIYAIRDIQPFEELTYDYQFKVSADEKITCTCGAKNCQGRLN